MYLCGVPIHTATGVASRVYTISVMMNTSSAVVFWLRRLTCRSANMMNTQWSIIGLASSPNWAYIYRLYLSICNLHRYTIDYCYVSNSCSCYIPHRPVMTVFRTFFWPIRLPAYECSIAATTLVESNCDNQTPNYSCSSAHVSHPINQNVWLSKHSF